MPSALVLCALYPRSFLLRRLLLYHLSYFQIRFHTTLTNKQNLSSTLTIRNKTHLLLSTLSTLSTANPPTSTSSASLQLPPDLHAVIELVTAQLADHIPDPGDREMIAGDVDYFVQNLDLVCEALGGMLEGVAERLCKVVDPICKCLTLSTSSLLLYPEFLMHAPSISQSQTSSHRQHN